MPEITDRRPKHRLSNLDPRVLNWLVVLGATAVSVALGSHDLASRPLSQDEVAGRDCSLGAEGQNLTCEGGDQALYYLLARLVYDVFGPSITVTRLISVLAGAATVPLVFFLGQRLVGDRVGRCAAVLCAVSVPMVFWQQNARGYVLGTLFLTASTLAFVVMVEANRRFAKYVYVLMTVLACYTLFFAAFIVGAQLLWLLIRRAPSSSLRRVAFAVGAAALCCLPLLPIAARSGQTMAFSWVPRPGPNSLLPTALALMSASSTGPITMSALVTAMGYVSLAACLGIICLATVRARRGRRDGTTSAVTLLGLWMLVPPAVVFLVSLGPRHYYVDRYFTICLPAAALLLAIILDRIRPVALGLGALVLLTVLRFSAIPPTYGVPIDTMWKQISSYVMASSRPEDCLTFSKLQGPMTQGAASDLVYWYSRSDRLDQLPEAVLPPFRWSAAANATFRVHNTVQAFSSVRRTCRRLWIVIEQGFISSDYLLVDSEVAWFARHGWPDIVTKKWRPVHVVLMQPRPSERH